MTVASPDTLTQLEFDRALSQVAAHAVSILGARAVRARRPSDSSEWITEQLAEVGVFRRLLDAGRAIDPVAIKDIGPMLERLATPGSVLDGTDLHDVARAASDMHSIRAGLLGLQDDAPTIAAWVVELPPRSIDRAIESAIDPEGGVRDSASPALAKVRSQLRAKRKALIAMLERLVIDRVGGESAVTVRGERFVVPVRRDDRNRVRGIVHGESSSGGTLFVEPEEAVDLGNELSALSAEESRAVLAVLRGLTDQLRPHVEALERGLEMCVRVDDLWARARHAVLCDGHAPAVGGTASVRILRGVHPLLVSEGQEPPIPFDLEFEDGERVLVVSGPNAGGKTVLLKSVGLICCLVQSGIIPPVGLGTRLPVFQRIFVDIGDHQSIAASLSSFSAHLTALKRVLAEADRHSLVLLDELGGGTDPIEGAALAGSVLLSLGERGGVTVVTTHLSELKELAAKTGGIVNGSLHFDVESLTPTYRFVKGRPGRSYGLAMARRLGLAPDILTVAEGLQPPGARRTDAMLADLERREESMMLREQAAGAEAARLERESVLATELRASLEERLTQLEERERALEREGREQSRKFLLEARRRVEEAIAAARADDTPTTQKEARRLVEDGVREHAEALAKLKREGWRVTSRNGEGRAGGKAATPERSGGTGARARAAEHDAGGPGGRSSVPDVEARAEVNLRGMTGDEAVFELIRALDSAAAADLPFVRIIHGKGTGALRARVSEVLRRDGRVRKFNVAPPHQGGTGVTIAELQS